MNNVTPEQLQVQVADVQRMCDLLYGVTPNDVNVATVIGAYLTNLGFLIAYAIDTGQIEPRVLDGVEGTLKILVSEALAAARGQQDRTSRSI